MAGAVLKMGGDCEIAGLAEDDFPDSWWAATLEAEMANSFRVKYRDVSACTWCQHNALGSACCLQH